MIKVRSPDWRKTAAILAEEKGITGDQFLDQLAKNYAPIGRFASPEGLAHIIVFLCSPRASCCVGSSYYVDGGALTVII